MFILRFIIAVLTVFLLAPAALASSPVIPDVSAIPIQGVYKTSAPSIVAIPAPTWVDTLSLTANSAATYTIPSSARILLIGGAAPIYICYTGTATIPSGTATNGSGSFLNIGAPVAVAGLTSISIISPSTIVITIAVYQ